MAETDPDSRATEMVERVARALCNASHGPTAYREGAAAEGAGSYADELVHWRALARVAMEAMREPTEEMLRLYQERRLGGPFDTRADIYRGLVSAALGDI